MPIPFAWAPDELLAIAMKHPMVFPPGTSWAFSDTNFMLLGQILEKASGRPYPELVKAQILDKVGLPNTSFPTPRRSRTRSSTVHQRAWDVRGRPSGARPDFPNTAAW